MSATQVITMEELEQELAQQRIDDAAPRDGSHAAAAAARAAPVSKLPRCSHTIIAEAVRVEDEPELFLHLGPRDVHPWHKPAMPSHEDIKASPHYPVYITVNPMAGPQVWNGVNHNSELSRQLDINTHAVPFESDLFMGRIEIHLKGLKTTRRDMFDGKKRHFQIACQGRFKRPVAAGDMCMGQEFVKAGNAPKWAGEMVLRAASKVFSSSAHVDVTTHLPYFMNPILAACQMVNVARPGEEPRDLWAAKEDMRLFAPELAGKDGKPLPADKRRKFCDVPRNLEGRSFDTEHVYTFHIWQHLIDFASYKLSVGGMVNLDMAASLAAQPLQLTCKDIKGEDYMFSALVWHERLLYDEETHRAGASLAARLSSVGTGIRSLLGMQG